MFAKWYENIFNGFSKNCRALVPEKKGCNQSNYIKNHLCDLLLPPIICTIFELLAHCAGKMLVAEFTDRKMGVDIANQHLEAFLWLKDSLKNQKSIIASSSKMWYRVGEITKHPKLQNNWCFKNCAHLRIRSISNLMTIFGEAKYFF